MLRSSILMLLSLLLVAAGCNFVGASAGIEGSGVVASETRDVDDFSRIRLNLPARVNVTAGAETLRVEIEADDNLLEHIRTEVSNGTLTITSDERLSPATPIVLNIQVPTLSDLQITGSGRVTLQGIHGDSLRLAISGSADISADGEVADLDVAVTGSGRLRLAQLDTQRATIRISGSGSVDLTCHETLDVRVSGSGSVTYRGDAEATSRISGSGRVRRAE